MIGESYIEYNGERYRLAFTMMQLAHSLDLIEEKKADISKTMGFITSVACIYFSAYVMACRQDRTNPVLSFEDLEMIVDYLFTNDKQQYNKIDEDFTASNVYKSTYGKLGDEKKTLQETKSEPLLLVNLE